ncbi:MAG: hypothetical protein H7141_08315 [Burkholderiales bacterium]|nr:hypothetical protein [Bacteroidia bacterium]
MIQVIPLMRYISFSSFIGLTAALFSQQQQMENFFLTSNINPSLVVSQTNMSKPSYFKNDNNVGNEMPTQINFDKNDIQEQSYNNVRQNKDSKNRIGNGINFSFNTSLRISSTGSSNSRSNRHTFTKNFKKFERHVFEKMGSHKKNKHLVDVCFNWR